LVFLLANHYNCPKKTYKMGKLKLKYKEIISELQLDCPPEEFIAKETKAYRWVLDKMENTSNFSPQYFKNPPRFENKPPDVKCKSLGLSFFSTEQQARIRFNVLTARMLQSVRNKIGKNVAEGMIYEKDGLVDLPDKNGHYTLHPSTEENLFSQFEIIGKL